MLIYIQITCCFACLLCRRCSSCRAIAERAHQRCTPPRHSLAYPRQLVVTPRAPRRSRAKLQTSPSPWPILRAPSAPSEISPNSSTKIQFLAALRPPPPIPHGPTSLRRAVARAGHHHGRKEAVLTLSLDSSQRMVAPAAASSRRLRLPGQRRRTLRLEVV